MMIRFFIWQLLLALDQLVNVLFGGYADEYDPCVRELKRGRR